MKAAGKLLLGGGLMVTGGAIVAGAYFGGLFTGIGLMAWSNEQDEKKSVVGEVTDKKPEEETT